MAERYDDSGLKEAILQVWTPAVGLQTIEDRYLERKPDEHFSNRYT